jgi:transcriptional antiterminator NusG
MGDEANFQWYVLKVQTNRESTIRKSLERAIQRDGMDAYFKRIVVPTEKVSEQRAGRKIVREHKLYPGYIFIEMELTDESWYTVRDISGVGDFTGNMGKPMPMTPSDVDKMLGDHLDTQTSSPKIRISQRVGETVKIKTGPFEGFSGSIDKIDEQSGVVTVVIEIFGRPTSVDLEHYNVEVV